DRADPARHPLHGPVPALQGLRPGDHRRARQHPRRRAGRARARPDRELDRRLLRDRLAGSRRVRDHDRHPAAAAAGAAGTREHAGRMKLVAAVVLALALAALPLLTTSNYLMGVGISALVFTVAA